MEQDIQKKFEEQDTKLEAIFVSVEKTRKYLLVTIWVTILMFVIPAIGLLFAIPKFINTYSNSLNGLL